MHIRDALVWFLCGSAAFPHRCQGATVQVVGNEATISVDGGARLLRNPGRKATRFREMVRGEILDQTNDKSSYEKFCAASALDMDHAEEEVQLSQLESLTPYADIPKTWLRYLQRMFSIDHSADGVGLLQKQRLENGDAPPVASISNPFAKRQRPSEAKLPSLSAEEEANAKEKLTSWRCLQAHGSNFGESDIRMTCKFKNLYFKVHNGQGTFVAHTLNSDGFTALPKLSFGVSSEFKDLRHTIEIAHHNTLADFVHNVLTNTTLINMEGLSLAFAPLYHFNVGHGLFDGLYPAFVSLLQHGEHKRPFRPVLVGPRLPEINEKCPMCYQHVEDIFGIIGGLNTTSTPEMLNRTTDATHRFDEIVIGIGTNSAKIDMNVNFTLGACRTLDACRAFRRRVYDFANVPLRPHVREKPPFQASVVKNKRFPGSWDVLLPWLQNNTKDHFRDFLFDSVTWTPPKKQEGAKINPDSVQLGDFRDHLRTMSEIDVLISSPGTAMMYQTFLPDGAIVINMGDEELSYMEEYMAEGSPYLRALYYPLRTWKTNVLFEESEMRKLMIQAQEFLTGGFKNPTPVNQNLSPMGRFYKAFAYWKHGQVISQEMLATDVPPQRAFWDIDMLGNNFLGPKQFAIWCCHQNGTFAGVMHALAKAYTDANPHQSNYFEDLLIKPSYPLQYDSDLSDYLQLSGLR